MVTRAIAIVRRRVRARLLCCNDDVDDDQCSLLRFAFAGTHASHRFGVTMKDPRCANVFIITLDRPATRDISAKKNFNENQVDSTVRNHQDKRTGKREKEGVSERRQ
jgi:hypothetical protein